MVRISVLIVLYTLGVSGMAQEPLDTLETSTELDAFVIEAKNQRVSAGETVSVPTSRQKQISAGGYDLLNHLSLTQILVRPNEEKVSTLSGADVAIFINGIKAQNFEVTGINTADVLRVEYLEYPIDTRFGGEKYVLNFVLKTYNQGGYVRVGEQAKLIQSTQSSSDIYVKHNYKKMSYDFYINYKYSNSHHEVSDTYETFSLLTPKGEPYIVSKQSIADYSRKRGWELPLSFRATYTGKNVSISNYGGYSHESTPVNIQKGLATIFGGSEKEYAYISKTADNNNSWWWSGDYNFNIGNGYSLYVLPNIAGTEFKHTQRYETYGADKSSIVNNSTDNFTHYFLSANLSKEISDRHTLGVNVSWIYNGHDITYSGTSQYRNKEFEKFVDVKGVYKFAIPSIFIINANLGLRYLSLGNDESKVSEIYPNIDIFVSYTPSPLHQFNIAFMNFHQMTLAHFFNSNTIRLSEYIYATGNPDSKGYENIHARFTYTWLQSNKFNVTAIANFNNIRNYACELYKYYDSGKALLRFPEMGFTFNAFQIGARVGYKPIEKLQLSALSIFMRNVINCDMRPHINQFIGNVRATYYFGKMYAGIEVGTPVTYFEYEQTKYKHPMPYGLTAGYGNGTWNVTINAENIFRKSWTPGITELVTPLYTSTSHVSDQIGCRYMGISVSYTFDYGKKIQHSDEISAQGVGQSAILK